MLARIWSAAPGDAVGLVGGSSSCLPGWPRLLVVVNEVAELTCRDRGEDRAARAASRRPAGGSARSPGWGGRRGSTSSAALSDRTALFLPRPGGAIWHEESTE